MDPTNELSAEVFDRYIAGLSLPYEREQVARWVGDDDERARWVRSIVTQTQGAARAPDFDGPAMLKRMEARLALEFPTETDVSTKASDTLLPVLYQAPGSGPSPVRRSLLQGMSLRRAAAIRPSLAHWPNVVAMLLVLIAGVIGVWYQVVARQSVQMREVVTRQGERVSLQLADGTQVVLGPNSRLRYTPVFGFAQREVTLTGLAYFTVVHDAAHPFVVRAHGTVIRELGTAFSVFAPVQDSSVKVVVSDGRVAFHAVSGTERPATILARGDMVTVDPSWNDGVSRVVRGVDIRSALAWTEGRLAFTEAPLRDVIRTLEEWYDLKIYVPEPKAASTPVTVEFNGLSADEVMLQLAEVAGFNYIRHGRYVTLFRSATGQP